VIEQMLFYLVVCDVEGCHDCMENESERELIDAAMAAGWQWHGQRTVCPNHSMWNGGADWSTNWPMP
jgi:hypothetical protein